MSKFSAIEGDDAIGAPAEIRQTATQLTPLLYEDLKRLARGERRRHGGGETLQTTALIHEAYLKLRDSAQYNDRAHFLRAAALAMRHLLINHARDCIAAKRGGEAVKLSLEFADEVAVPSDEALLEVNEALGRLAALSPRLAQVVECRYFAGYDDEETAEALNLTDRTVRRDWVKARAWLRRELHRDGETRRPDTP
ncbi:MAG TPA: ECF-type sigma factor [Steroidobacteraceae bacterium]